MDPGLINVLLNALIALLLTISGVLIFSFFWLRNDWYKLPDFSEGRYLKRLDTPENKFFPYIKRILQLLDEKNSVYFIKRYGFEYYFYLHFHMKISLYFLYSFLAICLVIVVYSFFSVEGWTLAYTRITGIYSKESKSHYLLNTMIMSMITMVMSLGLNSMTKKFRQTIALKSKTMQENPNFDYESAENSPKSSPQGTSPNASPRLNQYELHSPKKTKIEKPRDSDFIKSVSGQDNKAAVNEGLIDPDKIIDESDEYRFIMNTVLLYGCNPNDHNSEKLMGYLNRLMEKHGIQARIVDYYSPKDLRQMANYMIAIEETRVYWHNVAWLKLTGKCINRDKYKDDETYNKYIKGQFERLRLLKDYQTSAEVSGYTFLLFNTVTEIVKFKKLLQKNNQELRTDLMEAKLKEKDEVLKGESSHGSPKQKIFRSRLEDDDEIRSLMNIDEMELNIDYESTNFNVKLFSVPDNVIWDNVHKKDLTQDLKKISLNAIVLLMFIFMTTPSAGVQLLLNNKFGGLIFKIFALPEMGTSVGGFVKNYITVILTILFNLIFLYMIVVIARNNRFAKYSTFHRFVLNNTFVYLLLNMVLLPALALSFGNSIFQFISSKQLTFEFVVKSFYMIDYGTFFINIVLQSSCFIVLLDLNRFIELLDSGLSFFAANEFRVAYKNEHHRNKEVFSFKIGYNYAESAAIGVMVLFIGLYSPLLFLCGALFYTFKYMAHAPLIISVFDKEDEDFGSLVSWINPQMRNATGKMYIGILLGHFFLFVVCSVTLNFTLACMNFIMICGGIIFVYFINKSTSMEKFIKENKSIFDRNFHERDKIIWRRLYRHPAEVRMEQMSFWMNLEQRHREHFRERIESIRTIEAK